MYKPYLAGPINGCNDDQCIKWRQRAIEIFPNALNPMVRDYRGKEQELYREIVEHDKQDIRRCDALFVNYIQPSVGTAMEVFYAWTLKLPIVVWADPNTMISPWLRYHATHIVDSFGEAIATLKDLDT